VEQSTDGISWRSIHQQNAAGFSNHLITYEFIDQQKSSGAIYYRLKQFDVDGSFNTYGPTIVDCEENDNQISYSFPK
jgi:hypothetical protein